MITPTIPRAIPPTESPIIIPLDVEALEEEAICELFGAMPID